MKTIPVRHGLPLLALLARVRQEEAVTALVRALVLVVVLLTAGCSTEEGEQRLVCEGCNVVLVSVDTLRADRLSAYGYHRDTSPFLERLASEGTVFERFFQNGGGTLPSHLTMMTSLSPITHGIHPGNPARLADEWSTLAEVLSTAGYATAAFTDGGWMSAKFGFDRGFDQFEANDNIYLEENLPKAYRWLEQPRARPFFLFLHTYDVHSHISGLPYQCPSPDMYRYTGGYAGAFDGCVDGRCASRYLAWLNSGKLEGRFEIADRLGPAELEYLSALYDGCIRYVDGRLAELASFLERRGEWDDTVFVVISDHGEEFLEHGLLLHHQGGYDELARVPLVLRVPGATAVAAKVGALAAMIDFVPTLLDVLGLETPRQAQGRSWAAALAGQPMPSRRLVHMYSVLRTPRWKLFRDQRELYDLAADPKEQVNVYANNPQVAQSLEGYVAKLIKKDHAWAQSVGGGADELSTELELSAQEVENLKALGYLN